jgi:hypothetical protein
MKSWENVLKYSVLDCPSVSIMRMTSFKENLAWKWLFFTHLCFLVQTKKQISKGCIIIAKEQLLNQINNLKKPLKNKTELSLRLVLPHATTWIRGGSSSIQKNSINIINVFCHSNQNIQSCFLNNNKTNYINTCFVWM